MCHSQPRCPWLDLVPGIDSQAYCAFPGQAFLLLVLMCLGIALAIFIGVVLAWA